MRLTRRIALPTGLEICLSARPLPPDEAAVTPGELEGEIAQGRVAAPRLGDPPPQCE